MTNTFIYRIGDEVIAHPNKNPEFYKCWVPKLKEGARCVIDGYREAHIWRGRNEGRVYDKTGLYSLNGAVRIRDAEGNGYHVGSENLEFVTPGLYEQRWKEYRLLSDRNPMDEYVGCHMQGLPELPFYELDRVSCQYKRTGEILTGFIYRIDYGSIGKRCEDKEKSEYPIYNIQLDSGGSTGYSEEEVTLIRRGNIWKELKNQPLEFESVGESISFYLATGRGLELRNQAALYCSFTREEIVEGLLDPSSDIDYATVSPGFSTSHNSLYSAYKILVPQEDRVNIKVHTLEKLSSKR